MKRQVPKDSNPTYTLIGSGALARHWAFYLKSEKIPFNQWARKPVKEFNTFLDLETFEDQKFHKTFSQKRRLKKNLSYSSHVLLLISDKALSSFLKNHPFLYEKVLIHCSGALTLPKVHSAHPVMSFTHSIFKKSFYKKIFFVTESGKSSFSTLFPKLKNPSCFIDKNLKPLYHSYLSLSGNLSSFLWAQTIEKMKAKFFIPESALKTYLEGIAKNIKKHHLEALTGPLSRGEKSVIEKHKRVLKGDIFEDLYEAFLESYIRSLKENSLKKSSLKENSLKVGSLRANALRLGKTV